MISTHIEPLDFPIVLLFIFFSKNSSNVMFVEYTVLTKITKRSRKLV